MALLSNLRSGAHIPSNKSPNFSFSIGTLQVRSATRSVHIRSQRLQRGTKVYLFSGLCRYSTVSGMRSALHGPTDLILVKAPMYYRNANCAVVVYDITQTASLEKARSWIRELQRQADPSIVIALCGNKLDLAARRQVTQEEAQKYAEEEGLMWAETSAKNGEGVADIFTRIGQSTSGGIRSR